jgi:glycosyltransferase involved in cell wall biosynthesis
VSGFEFLADARLLPAGRDSIVATEACGRDGEIREVGRARVRRTADAGLPPFPPPVPTARRGRSGVPRLLIVSHGLGHAGGFRFVVDLARWLSNWEGFQVTVLSLGPAPRAPELAGAGIVVREEAWPPTDRATRFEEALRPLKPWVADGSFDVVLIASLAAFPGAELAPPEAPVVWAIHESQGPAGYWEVAFPAEATDPDVVSRARRRLRSAAGVVFVSESTRRLFEGELAGVETAVIPLGVTVRSDDPDRRAARERLGVPPGDRLVLCLGRVEPRKGQTVLVEALARLASSQPKLRLALVGAEVPDLYLGALSDQIHRHGLGDRVALIPTTPNVGTWLEAAEVLVCASDVESLPFAVLEAMASAVVVVSTAVFGVPDVVEDGVSGYLCTPCDVGALARAIVRAIGASPEERAKMLRRGAAVIRERHEPRRAAATFARLLRRVATGSVEARR